ncbi:MAG: EscU/YscU/HrcU family type III secretion system export apparatus switch protein [Acidimicrobiales bacterium]|jgi:flagellar biosynthetic protein FlhB
MPDEDKHSKTEKPTARRKKEARHDGTVARTPEVVSWIVVFAGTYLMQHTFEATYALEQRLWFQIANNMAHPSLSTDGAIIRVGGEGALLALAPALLATMAIALAVNLAQTRGLITFAPLKPSFKNLNPAKGLKKIISPRSLWETGKQIIRVGLLGLIVWQVLSGVIPEITANGGLSSSAVASLVASRSLALVREVAAISLVLAVLDYIVQYRKVARQLRMTKHEVKEEAKSTEGNPQMKGAIRRRQRQMARNRMIASVAKADAVVVNPTHFAVAVSYVRGRGAPRVVAKGTDFMALQIREEAVAHRVPLVEDPPLARALYVACDLEQEIPTEFYEAVARLLTFIYSLRANGRSSRIDGAPFKPAAPLLTGSTGGVIAGGPARAQAGGGADGGTGPGGGADGMAGAGARGRAGAERGEQ